MNIGDIVEVLSQTSSVFQMDEDNNTLKTYFCIKHYTYCCKLNADGNVDWSVMIW